MVGRTCPIVLLLAGLLLGLTVAPGSAHLNGYKIGIDPGHGGTDPGAVGAYGLNEKDINLTYSLRMRDYLQADGATVPMTRTTDATLSLSERSSYLNAQDCDYSACNHNNASDAETADYSGSHVYLGACPGTAGDFAYSIVHRMNSHTQIGYVSSNCSREGVHEDDFHMVRVTTMPSFLQEGAFISNHCEEWRMRKLYYMRNFGWAVYAGVCDQLSTAIPGTPTNFRVENLGDGRVRLRWSAVTGANGYRIYISSNGDAFTSDTLVAATECIYSGLSVGTPVYFCVAAHISDGSNASVGYQTEILGCTPTTDPVSARILIVNTFDRQSADLGNLRNFVPYHGEAIAAAGRSFESVSDECISDGTVSLTGYCAVDFLCGQASTPDSTISTAQQTALISYLTAGGKLFVSGAEVGWDLEAMGTTGDQDFLHTWLRTDYIADSSGSHTVAGSSGGIFDGLSGIVFWGHDNGTTEVKYPDCYAPLSSATTCLTYTGTSYNAGIAYDGSYKLVNLGFPFESISDQGQRETIMADILNFFGTCGSTPHADVYLLESRQPDGTLMPTPTYREFGVWANSTSKSTATGLLGQGSRFSDTSVLDSRCLFEPSLTQHGIYRVWITWGQSANATHVQVTVRHSGGWDAQYLDQDGWGGAGASNANEWILLGDYEFRLGPDSANAAVEINEVTVTGRPSEANNPRVYADGVKFQLITALDVESSIPPPAVDGLRLYPNPASEWATLELPKEFTGFGTLRLYAVDGRLLHNNEIIGLGGSKLPVHLPNLKGKIIFKLSDDRDGVWHGELIR